MHHLDNYSSLGFDYEYWASTEPSSLANVIAETATIAAFALGILGSSYLALRNPSKWWLSTLSIAIVNLYTLPKMLRYGNPTVIKMALVANLTTLSCLSLGGINAASYSLSLQMLAPSKTPQSPSALKTALFITGLLGYGVPFFQDALQKAYRFLHDDKVQDKLTILYDHFHNQPEIELGFLQGNFWKSFILHLTLFKPSFILGFCDVFDISPPDYVWPVAVAASETTSLEHFNQLLDSMKEIQEKLELEAETLSEEMKRNYYLGLNFALKSIDDKDLRTALEAVMTKFAHFVPAVISKEQFLSLFQEENLLNLADNLIEEFISLADSWDDLIEQYNELSEKGSQLKLDIESLNLKEILEEEEEELLERHDELRQNLLELRKEIEQFYMHKRFWQSLGTICESEDELPFKSSTELWPLVNDDSFLKEIDTTYRELISDTKQNGSPTLASDLQICKNKLDTMHGDEESEEETSVIMYLGACRGFVQGDYQDLQSWLDLDSPFELEEAFEKIGLATEEDLYEHEILPREGPEPTKTEIRNSLHAFIKTAKPLLAKQVQSEEEIEEDSDLGTTMDKVTRTIYYLISGGLILAPVLFHPHAGGMGFAAGLCFFTLQYFGVPGTQMIAETICEIIDEFPLGSSFRSLLSRRVFSITSRRRESANHFVDSNLYTRIRIINAHILFSLFLTNFNVRHAPYIVGSFAQGVALSQEVVELVT